jgi:two-component system, response regulator PdtaR
MHTVLIAEDDLNVANALAEVAVNGGYGLCGIARTVEEAIELGLTKRPQVAVLDLRLADRRPSTEVAAHLAALGNVAILYTTGNVSRFALTAAHGHACLTKPYSSNTFLRSLDIVLNLATGGTVSRPLPPGFRMLRKTAIIPDSEAFRF